MEAASILGLLQARVALVPGGRDREGRPILIVPAPPETQIWNKNRLDTVLRYFASIFSPDTRRNGVCAIVDAQASSWRMARLVVRQVSETLGRDVSALIVLRPEAFWDKQRVDNCARSHKDGEPTYTPLSRLHKYVDPSQLPAELNGTWHYNHDQWIHNRNHVEVFVKDAENAVAELERLRLRLGGDKDALRLSTAEASLSISADLYCFAKDLAAKALHQGRSLLERIDRDFAYLETLPQDLIDTKDRVNKLLEIIEQKLILVEEAWINLHRKIFNAKEIDALEEGVRRVTDWVLGPGETMLNTQQEVGYDVASSEDFRRDHEALELQCRETYGHFAELLHKIDTLAQNGVTLPEDLKAQRDFMNFVCRSFATRLERRRNILITSSRFFRLVAEYFQTTSEVYENLVMSTDIENSETAHYTLLELQDCQVNIDNLENEIVREGEKLSDLLSMPVKDALGCELEVDYEGDIINVREILDMTTARRQLFRDSVELQRLTLQQVTHIHDYENDATQAVQWLEDLFHVLLKSHSYVGSNIYEIQMQKDRLQAFQETAKASYEYGCQLLNAALTLRQSCKLPQEKNGELTNNLWQAWKKLNLVGQEQLTRLRVSAVFYRTVQQQCKQLNELLKTLKEMELEEGAAGKGKWRVRVKRLLASRERLLLEVGRMVRLGRLLRTRLKEPLCQELANDESNSTAIAAIAEQLSEVTGSAEKLDAALCGSQSEVKKILEGIFSSVPSSEEWFSSLPKPKSEDGHENRSDEDFLTASESTPGGTPEGTPPSQASFQTASEGDPWWDETGSDLELIDEKQSTPEASTSSPEVPKPEQDKSPPPPPEDTLAEGATLNGPPEEFTTPPLGDSTPDPKEGSSKSDSEQCSSPASEESTSGSSSKMTDPSPKMADPEAKGPSKGDLPNGELPERSKLERNNNDSDCLSKNYYGELARQAMTGVFT
ncbi:unnamed protein product [Bemisia tabaci]|uniref:CRAL-TRIO domain-containing protein n=1 Tax=Bemisia tabaci TaxID=7038 RepID=A0A9P0A539_BEMTA|nr:unnamed protein product [Bemisia tabaci]